MHFVPKGVLLVIVTLKGDWYVVIKAYINFLYCHTNSIIIVLKHRYIKKKKDSNSVHYIFIPHIIVRYLCTA